MYVGKAKNLKNRITSYTQYAQLAPRIKKLVSTAHKLKFEILDSELEALLIEAELIRVHQPFFNVRLKDDKSPIYLVVTTDEPFPVVLRKRKTDIVKEKPRGTVLGPFQSGFSLNEVLKIARKIFPWCADPHGGRPCFYYHLDLCPGACVGDIPESGYRENIDQLILFLRGKKKAVLKDLTAKMKAASEAQQYEKAQEYKEKIQHIEEVTKKQYRLAPSLVLPGFGMEQAKQGVVELQKILQTYAGFPRTAKLTRIEGFDVSNISGTNAAVSMVTFTDGQPDTDHYRLFNIRTLQTPNDYHMLQEALQRRQNHPEWGKPDLTLIDGGKGQVRAVLKVWQWENPVIGIAKKPDRLVIPIHTEGEKLSYEIITLPADHPALKLIARIRNESHRFAKKQFHKRHIKKLLK